MRLFFLFKLFNLFWAQKKYKYGITLPYHYNITLQIFRNSYSIKHLNLPLRHKCSVEEKNNIMIQIH